MFWNNIYSNFSTNKTLAINKLSHLHSMIWNFKIEAINEINFFWNAEKVVNKRKVINFITVKNIESTLKYFINEIFAIAKFVYENKILKNDKLISLHIALYSIMRHFSDDEILVGAFFDEINKQGAIAVKKKLFSKNRLSIVKSRKTIHGNNMIFLLKELFVIFSDNNIKNSEAIMRFLMSITQDRHDLAHGLTNIISSKEIEFNKYHHSHIENIEFIYNIMSDVISVLFLGVINE